MPPTTETSATAKANSKVSKEQSRKAYYHYALESEKSGNSQAARKYFHEKLRTAVLNDDEESQAALINCLIRGYLKDNLYDLATKFVQKVKFPETADNSDWARYYYYLGCIQAMQMSYPKAHEEFLKALRMCPQNSGSGFKQAVQKMKITVELLQGEIPERATFRQPLFRKCLQPYFLLTQAVRTGDLKKFDEALKRYSSNFAADGTRSLVVRLRQTVVRTALKQIAEAYSRISIPDVREKLELNLSQEDVENIIAKAIGDNVIDGVLNHKDQYLKSLTDQDVYHTPEPQVVFHDRIKFCLALRNECVKSMRFPPKRNEQFQTAEESREREQQNLELALKEEDEDSEFS